MKSIGEMSMEELAGFICEQLRSAGVTVTLTGGSCVQIWSEGGYMSHDLDFIEDGPVARNTLRGVLRPLGFVEQGRHFAHPSSEWIVEFPTGPLMVGEERIERFSERRTAVGVLRLLTATDCVKDRLAAFYHWNDRQSLEQAILVARAQRVDLADVRRWSIAEGHLQKFSQFRRAAAPRKRRSV